jgi:hypothetical protein
MSEPGDKDDDIIERIRKEGELVWSVHWDGGTGADVESIYKFKDEYWHDGCISGLSGPFESFAEVMEEAGGFWVGDATEIIYCGELIADEFATRADVSDASPGQRIEINGEEWEVSPDGKLERAGGRKSA